MLTIINSKKVLILILVLATFLRLFKIFSVPPALFGDELDLGYHAYSILKTGRDYQGNFMPLNFHSMAEWRTPLYLYSAVPSVAIFGITPLGVRLPAAIFGIINVLIMFLVSKKILEDFDTKTANRVSLMSALLLSISPWSLQYSRAGFEVTEMLFLLLLGVYFFLKSRTDSKFLWLSVLMFLLTPWVYSTAKLFTPVFMVLVFLIYRKEILMFKKSDLIKAVVVGFVIGLPLVYGTFFKGGTQRIGNISIFTDTNMEQTVGFERDIDNTSGVPKIISKSLSNKYVYYGSKFINNYFESFSTQFLFLKGDLNLRQSVGWGMLFIIEIVPLLIGFASFFFTKQIKSNAKALIAVWMLVAPIASSFTVSGGLHATRLFLILPVYIFLIAFGWIYLYGSIDQKHNLLFKISIAGLYIISFVFYLHRYYITYPVESARWWHYGWGPAMTEVKSIDRDYDRVFISMSGEPAWIFFAGWYEYPPAKWQKEFPVNNDVDVPGFGKISHTGKFYFGSPDSSVQIYGLGKYLTSKDLYVANAKEDGDNLITNPEKTPPGLRLLKSIALPSGEPSIYIFAGTAR